MKILLSAFEICFWLLLLSYVATSFPLNRKLLKQRRIFFWKKKSFSSWRFFYSTVLVFSLQIAIDKTVVFCSVTTWNCRKELLYFFHKLVGRNLNRKKCDFYNLDLSSLYLINWNEWCFQHCVAVKTKKMQVMRLLRYYTKFILALKLNRFRFVLYHFLFFFFLLKQVFHLSVLRCWRKLKTCFTNLRWWRS